MKKNIYCTFDTEATAKQLIYNLGYVIHNRKGEILTRGEWVISDIYNSPEVLTAYYADKLPLYNERIKAGLSVVTFKQMIDELKYIMRKYKVNKMSAYNANYDINALFKTAVYTDNNIANVTNCREYIATKFLNVEIIDIYPFAVHTLLNTNKYFNWVCNQILNGIPVDYFFTEAGNLRTGAENVYKYITNEPHFIEEHTALSDSIIETQILTKCFKTHKLKRTAIDVTAWRIIQESFKSTINGILKGNLMNVLEKVMLINKLPQKVLK